MSNQQQELNTQSIRIVDKLEMNYFVFISVSSNGEKGFHNFRFELSRKKQYGDDTRFYRNQWWIPIWKMV